MKLLVKLSGFNNYDKEIVVDWDDDILAFPKFGKYDSKFWGWIFYDKDDTGKADYMLLFSEHKQTAIPVDQFGNLFPVSDFETMFHLETPTVSDCECGAKFTAFPNNHMYYCPRWRSQ